jgi:diguanylate cyclase (GGDEF)-like protein
MIDAAFLETLVRESPDPVVVLRSNRTIEALNPALARLTRAARMGADFMTLVSDAARERVLGLLVRAAGGDEQLIEVPHPQGEEETVVEYRFFPCEGGRVAGLGRVRPSTQGAELGRELGRAQERLKAQSGMLDRIQLELTQVPFIDPVTGVWNKMQVVERLTGEWSRSERYGSPISCLIIEVETAAGLRRGEGAALADEVLKTVARRIKGTVRDHDVVGRYGGDRFVVVAVHSDAEGARSLGVRIRDQAGREPVTAAGRRHAVQLRIGGATNRSEGVEILEDLFTVAESALADAKQADEPVRIAAELGV